MNTAEATTLIPRHLRTDLHLHSTFSDGRADVPTMVAAAQRAGFQIAISDHYSDPYGMIGDERLSRYLDTLEQYPIYRAVELDLGNELAMSTENRARLDYCVGSLHGVLGEDGKPLRPDRNSRESMRRYMDTAVAQIVRGFRTGIHSMIGHPTFLPELPHQGQEELWEPHYRRSVIEAALETGVALELSTRYPVPNPTLVREALDAGVRFAVASDGHGPEAVGAISRARQLIEQFNIPADRFFLPERVLDAQG